MRKDILICGVGGQGTVLASKILAASAMAEGQTVHSAETIGMAQRGGSVTSHVRIGEEAFSPMIPLGSADLLMAFEPAEAVRNLKYLRPSGIVIVNTDAVKPVTESLRPSGYEAPVMIDYLREKCGGACFFVSMEETARRFGSSKFFNVMMLGIAAGSGALGLAPDTLRQEIARRVPEKFREINLQAFDAGCEQGTSAHSDT